MARSSFRMLSHAGMHTEYGHRYRHQVYVCVSAHFLLLSADLSCPFPVFFASFFILHFLTTTLDFKSRMMVFGFSHLWLHLLNYHVLLTLQTAMCEFIPPPSPKHTYTHKPHSSS